MNAVPTAAPIQTRLRITHALLDHMGTRAGVRVLHVKGVTLSGILAEGRKSSTDCDVLVHPDDVSTYISTLTAAGWEVRTRFEHGSVFEHAATLYHDVWGTVDVHRAFPGVDADPAATFEKWWEVREIVQLGGHDIATLSDVDQRVMLILHAARSGVDGRPRDVRVAWDDACETQREQIEKRAIELGGKVPFMIVTDPGDGTRRATVAGSEDYALWDAVGRGADATEIWTIRLRSANSLTEKAAVLWRAAHVNRDHLGIQLGHEPTRAEIAQEWLDRLSRGAGRLRRLGRREKSPRARVPRRSSKASVGKEATRVRDPQAHRASSR